MNHLNTVIIEGNVVRQAERSEPAPGFKVCKFSIAVNRYYRDASGEWKEDVSYIDVDVHGNYGESVERNCVKGRGVRVVGKLKQDRWESADGKKNSKLYIIAEHIEYKPLKSGSPVSKDVNFNSMRAAEVAAAEEDAYEEAAGF